MEAEKAQASSTAEHNGKEVDVSQATSRADVQKVEQQGDLKPAEEPQASTRVELEDVKESQAELKTEQGDLKKIEEPQVASMADPADVQSAEEPRALLTTEQEDTKKAEDPRLFKGGARRCQDEKPQVAVSS
jgi:hypothetical protein